jgi:hypothetical protein
MHMQRAATATAEKDAVSELIAALLRLSPISRSSRRGSTQEPMPSARVRWSGSFGESSFICDGVDLLQSPKDSSIAKVTYSTRSNSQNRSARCRTIGAVA